MTRGPGSALIVGGDGVIGSGLVAELKRRGLAVTRTSRRLEVGGALKLDLEHDTDFAALADRRFDTAFLCAAMTSVRECETLPELARLVNVDRPAALARQLSAAGTFVLYLSSSAVFDGERPLPAENDPPAPRTEYGRHKASMEEALLAMEGPVAVVRLSKVLHGALPIIAEWREALDSGRAVVAFEDMLCSPLLLAETVDGLVLVAERQAAGIWHFSNSQEVSYLLLAREFARARGARVDLVRPAAARAVLPPAQVPRHAALDARRTRTELGVTFADTSDVISAIAAA